ncbi:MAG: right-handed parallel beta-helix repeat-containing protein, partial [Candidatus Zixiibacteriota bacterium]
MPEVWRFTMRHCLWRNNTFSFLTPVSIKAHAAVILDSNTFVNNTFSVSRQHDVSWPDWPGLVLIRSSSPHLIVGNTGSGNSFPAISWLTGPPTTNAHIHVSDSLPLFAVSIYVPDSCHLTIDSGSVIKMRGSIGGTIRVEGTLEAHDAIFTSWMDNDHGANTDPEPIYGDQLLWGDKHAIEVTPSGSLSLNGCSMLYANYGIQVEGDATVNGCIFARNVGVLDFVGQGSRDYSVRNSVFRNNWKRAAILFDSDINEQSLTVSDCDLINNWRGVDLTTSSTLAPIHATIRRCNISGNVYDGIKVSPLDGGGDIDISRCLLMGNGDNGIFVQGPMAYSYFTTVTNSVIAGNGSLPLSLDYENGIDLMLGDAMLVNNTIAYNLGSGIRLLDELALTDSVVNTIIVGNHKEGILKGFTDLIGFAHNAIYDNGTTRELYFNTPNGGLTTVDEIQALGGDYATNYPLPPGFEPPVYSAAVEAVYDTLEHVTRVITDNVQFDTLVSVPALFYPDTSQSLLRRFYVDTVRADTIIVAGDATADVAPGSIFSIQGYHLSPTSPVIDMGGYTSRMGGFDIDGQPRVQDGDFDGNAVVDIGADELPADSAVAPLQVTRPVEGQLCLVGDTTTIEWSAPATDSVDLLYTVDYDSAAGVAVWMYIDTGVPADTPGYLWRIPAAWSPRCRVMVVDAADSSRHAMSAPFRIKGYVLTRLTDDSTYLPFLPYEDGWAIPNDSADMWPESWYRRFDYDTATDPFT